MAGRAGREIYRTRRWRRLRYRVLVEADWRCAKCGAFADEVHHIVPIAMGGAPFDRDNAQALCRTCHFTEHRKLGPKRCTPDSAERAAWRHRLADMLNRRGRDA